METYLSLRGRFFGGRHGLLGGLGLIYGGRGLIGLNLE